MQDKSLLQVEQLAAMYEDEMIKDEMIKDEIEEEQQTVRTKKDIHIPISLHLFQRNIIVPADLFNANPISTLQSYVGIYSNIECYKVANGVTNDNFLTVQVYYKALDFNRPYYIIPKELELCRLEHQTQLQFIVDGILISLPMSMKNSTDVIPIQVRPITNVSKMDAKRIVQTQYFARPMKSCLKYISTLYQTPADSNPKLFIRDKPSTTVEFNEQKSEKSICLEDLYKLKWNIPIFAQLNNVLHEVTQIKKYMATMSMQTQLHKAITTIEYHNTIPTNTVPKANNVAYITHYNKELKEFIQKYHFGLLFTIPTRSYPNIVVYVPSIAYKCTIEQLEAFEHHLFIDIVNFSNVAYVKSLE